MAPSNIVLLACGAYNPPTYLHLRMFEIARDHLNRLGCCNVIGGIISPVHDGYGKNELVSATHRCEMVRLALQTSDWIRLSDWECRQESWSRTRMVLQYHQNQLNSILNSNNESPNKRQRLDDLLWIPNDIKFHSGGPVQVKLLCGADLLESFATPGLWSDDDIENIVGQHGLVVITREGNNPNRLIYESDILTKYQNNIRIVTNWITNEVSSTRIRRALRRSESVKYTLPDFVIDYINKHGLYGSKDKYMLLQTLCIYYVYKESETIFHLSYKFKKVLTMAGNTLQHVMRKNVLSSNHTPCACANKCKAVYTVESPGCSQHEHSSQCLLTPSPSDVNMESESPVSSYAKYDYSESVNIEQMSSSKYVGGPLMNGPSTFINIETLDKDTNDMKSMFVERMSNEENSKRSAVSIGYPGQAVQIIATHKGENLVHTEK
ncbi:hypothetical protein L9F63_010434, partial [Diploptera punctata]